LSEGFGEYKKLREQGYSKEEAAAISLGKISSEFLLAKAEEYLEKYPATKGKLIIRSSDAHYLENMRPAEFYAELEENSAEALISFLKGEYYGICRSRKNNKYSWLAR
jgi:hypothetical protein